MKLRKAMAVLLLVILAATSTLLLQQLENQQAPGTAAGAPGIGYYLNQATLTGTGKDGRMLYRLLADEVVQQPADGSVSLRGVAVDYDPARAIPWRLTADSGEILDEGRLIALSGNVVAATREQPEGPVATIRTDYLEFDPATDIAATDHRVLIDYGGSTVQARGLRALLREDRLQLLAEVSGRYAR